MSFVPFLRKLSLQKLEEKSTQSTTIHWRLQQSQHRWRKKRFCINADLGSQCCCFQKHICNDFIVVACLASE